RELRAVARTDEMFLSIVVGVGAPEVRTGDRECAELSVVASHKAGKRRIARRIVLTTIRHQESRAHGRVEARDASFLQVGKRSVECDPNLFLGLVRVAWGKEIHGEWCGDGDDCGLQ